MGSRAEPAISPLTDPSYADLEDYFEKVRPGRLLLLLRALAAACTPSSQPRAVILKPSQVIQLNQLEMLHGKHLVAEATYNIPPNPNAPHAPPRPPFPLPTCTYPQPSHCFSFSYTPLAHRLLSDISSQKDVIRYHPQYQSMPQNDVAPPSPLLPPPPPPPCTPPFTHNRLPRLLFLRPSCPSSRQMTSAFGPRRAKVFERRASSSAADCSAAAVNRNARAGQASHHSRHPAARRH